ncbi:MAG: TatD family hydrolase [Spirochaetaceae bacterium]|nr:TatD family hydrolase [Spirochaetaceae bacterium]
MDKIITYISARNITLMDPVLPAMEMPRTCFGAKNLHQCNQEQGISVGLILNNIREKGLWEKGTEFSLSISRNNLKITPFIGIHPWDSTDASKEIINSLEEISSKTGAFIGEFGFDKLKGADKEKQLYLFRNCLDIALKTEKPFTIHCVRSWGLLTEELQKVKNRIKAPFIIHAYSGSAEAAKTITELGGYPSFGLERYGAFSRKAEESISKIDLKHLLLETDFTCYSKQPPDASGLQQDDKGLYGTEQCSSNDNRAAEQDNGCENSINVEYSKEDNYYGKKYLKRLLAVYNEAASVLKMDITELSGVIEENGKVFKAYTANRK